LFNNLEYCIINIQQYFLLHNNISCYKSIFLSLQQKILLKVVFTVTLFQTIQDSLPKLSEAKKKVAYYILDNWYEAAFLPAAKVAKHANVSESVVVRFAQDIGYGGFPYLQESLRSILKNRLTGITPTEEEEQKVSSINHPIENQEVNNVFNLTLQNVNHVLVLNEIEKLNKFVDFIFEAKKIFVLARRNSLGPAHILSVHLNEVFTNTFLLDSGSDLVFDFIRGMGEEDLLVSIGIPAYGKRMVQEVEYAHERKISHISITDSMSSPFAAYADEILLTSVKSYSYASSHVATLFLIDLVMHLVTQRKKGEILKSLEEINILNERFGLTHPI
jgi:DNA-binding MurR/RpiR family transcriptional regulator